MSDEAKKPGAKGVETLLPRLVSFLVRERVHARKLSLQSASDADVVDEWELAEGFSDAELENVASCVMAAALDYAANLERRVEFVLRVKDAAENVRGTGMRFRGQYTPQSEQFNRDTPEGRLLAYLFTQNEKQAQIINALPDKAVRVYEQLLLAAAGENERLSKRNQDQALEIRLLYEALRDNAGVDEETAAAVAEAEQTNNIVGEIKEVVGAIVTVASEHKRTKAAQSATSSATTNGSGTVQ